MVPLSGLSKIQDFLGCDRSPGSSEVNQWSADIAVMGSRPLIAEIFQNVNETPFYTSFHYHPPIVLI